MGRGATPLRKCGGWLAQGTPLPAPASEPLPSNEHRQSLWRIGPGYRVYFKRQGRELILLLAGGDKATQADEIKEALRLARNL
jgi:hypothetical protein